MFKTRKIIGNNILNNNTKSNENFQIKFWIRKFSSLKFDM